MDMAVDAQHRVHILHMWNGYKYGPSLPPGSPEPGIYDSVRDDSGNWTHARIGAICIGGYWQTEDALQAIYQDRGAIVTRGWSADANQWTAQRTLLEGDKTPGFPGFMDVLSSNSGSKLPAGPAIVVSSVMPGTDKIPTYALWSILP